MKIGGFGELENIRRAISRDNAPTKSDKKDKTSQLNAVSKDEVQVSDIAIALGKLKNVPEIREDKVNEIKEQVDAGTYLTPEKVESGIRGLLGGL